LNFECKQLDITNDFDFGCTISFSDTIEKFNENQTIEELIKSQEKYLLIQRSFPEDEDGIDWYTIESSEIEINFSQKDDIYVKLCKKEIEINCSGITMVIGLKLSDKEYSKLDNTLRSCFKDKVVMMKE
jgi:hypothetical protein